MDSRQTELLNEARIDFQKYLSENTSENLIRLRKKNNFPECQKIMIYHAKYEGILHEEGSADNICIEIGADKEPNGSQEILKKIEKISISKVSSEGYIFLKTKNGTEFVVRFACFCDADDSFCITIGNNTRNIKDFAKEFVNFFLFEFLSIRGIKPHEWNNLDYAKYCA